MVECNAFCALGALAGQQSGPFGNPTAAVGQIIQSDALECEGGAGIPPNAARVALTDRGLPAVASIMSSGCQCMARFSPAIWQESKRSPDGAAAKSGAVEDVLALMVLARSTVFRRDVSMLMASQKESSGFSSTPSEARLYCGPSLPPRGRCLDRLGRVGRERRPRRSGPGSRSGGSRLSVGRRPGAWETAPPVPGVPCPPLRHHDWSALAAEKVWTGRPSDAVWERRRGATFQCSANPALPHPSPRPGHASGRQTGHAPRPIPHPPAQRRTPMDHDLCRLQHVLGPGAAVRRRGEQPQGARGPRG